MLGRWRALAIVPVAAMLVTGSALAQEGTPEADATENPRLVDPSECVIEPRAYEEVAGILQLEGEGVPAPDYTPITPPLGEIAPPETELAIKETARHMLACFNAGDFLRASSLLTENGIQRAFWGLTIDAENRQLAQERLPATPEARAEEFLTRLITVTDVSTLPDGRVAAFIVQNEPLLPPAGPETLLFIFANQDGQWMVDDFVDFSIVAPTAATPTP